MNISIQLPKKVTFEQGEDPNAGVFVMQPLFIGYGTTVGNALRRVLLSSLPGAAITGVKIKGVQHEFSTVPNVMEDMVEIILNLKQVRIKVHGEPEETLRAKLSVKGEKKVKAGDIKGTSDMEIMNKDLHIATLTSGDAELEIEFVIEQGLGYLPVELREKENDEVGMMAIDAIFTPVLKVSYDVENVRVGQMTNFNKLTLEVTTDGTIDPKEAVRKAVQILSDHYSLFLAENAFTEGDDEDEEDIEVAEEDEGSNEGADEAGGNDDDDDDKAKEEKTKDEEKEEASDD